MLTKGEFLFMGKLIHYLQCDIYMHCTSSL